MKKSVFILALLTLLFGLYSCQEKEDVLEEMKGKSMSFEAFFEKVSNKKLKISDEKVLLIDYEWNAQSKTISVLSSREAEPTWGLALEIAEKKNLARRGGKKNKKKKKYTVHCDKGGKDGKGTSTNCSGKFSCGKAVYDCVEKGGCATICEIQMVFVEETLTFYLPQNIEKFIDKKDLLDTKK